jgi:hypothetical protein
LPTWDNGSAASATVISHRLARELLLTPERPLESSVSRLVGDMSVVPGRALVGRSASVVCVPVEERAARPFVQRNAIALISNFERTMVEPPSPTGRGHHSARPRVRDSGLWNNEHVEGAASPPSST